MRRRYTGRKRARPTRYDRVQDRKIRKLQIILEVKEDTNNAQTLTLVNGTPQVFDLDTLMATETAANPVGRVGDKISLVSHTMRARFNQAASGATIDPDGTLLRIACVWDRRPLGVIATAAEMFAGGGTAITHLHSTAEQEKGRFQFLYDQVFTVPKGKVQDNQTPFTYLDGNQQFIKWYINLKGKTSDYSAVTDDQTSLQKGQLLFYILALGNSSNMNFIWARRFKWQG